MAKALSEEHQAEARTCVPEEDGGGAWRVPATGRVLMETNCLDVFGCKAWRTFRVLGSEFCSKTGQKACSPAKPLPGVPGPRISRISRSPCHRRGWK